LLRDLFFPPPVFEPSDGDAFILQVQRVFTRIRSGAALVASGGGARGSSISHAAAEAIEEGNSNGSILAAATEENGKP
jgi:hypothetical protein